MEKSETRNPLGKKKAAITTIMLQIMVGKCW